MNRGRLEYMLSNPSEGVNIWLRDTYLGYQSDIWESMQKQQTDDAVTDICVPFTRYIRKNDRDYTTPILARNVLGGYKATPLGEEVAKILINTSMENCKIVQYSINANQVEKANNRLSMVVYAHFSEPHTKQETILLVGDEIEERIMEPIKTLLSDNEAYLGLSNYNDRDLVMKRQDLEELLIKGSEGYWFMKGLF